MVWSPYSRIAPHVAKVGKMLHLFAASMIVAVSIFLGDSPDVLAEQHFPYAAAVGAQSAYVRSGPGQKHYPTQVLSPGEQLEVYRHDAGGWCAVRPPQGAFSWIASHDVQRHSENHGVVAVEHCTVRVGSDVSPARSAVQVLLYQGSPVQILPSEPQDDPRWLRISPPSGEFRWVALSDLATQAKPAEIDVELTSVWASHSESETSLDAEPTSIRVPTSPYDDDFPTSDSVQIIAGSPAENQLKSVATQPPGMAPPQPLNSNGSLRESIPLPLAFADTAVPLPLQQMPSPLSNEPPVSNDTPRRPVQEASKPLSAELAEFELQLSQIVVRPKDEWDFTELQKQVQVRWDSSDSVSERQKLGDLLERIASFQGVKNIDWNIVPTPHGSQPLSDLQQHVPAHQFTGDSARIRQLAMEDLDAHDPFERRGGNGNAALYDAVGKLKPVVSRKQDAPPYALIDEHGEVVSFVTPTPDLNLQPYVGRRIGVRGTRGFIPEYRRAHVVAAKVTPIQNPARR